MNPEIHKLVLYTPHAKQLELHNCKKRFAIASFGRQSGKSTCAINHMLKSGWENPGTKYWFVSPTFAQSKVMYRRLYAMLWTCRDVMLRKSDTELRINLINGSELRFVSGEVLDNLRGETLDGAIIDEVREQHSELWPMVIRPMLATTKGWCWFVSTPNGYDHFYDLAQKAKEDPDWELFTAPSTANPLFSIEEFEAAKRTLSEPQFAQEILAEFRSLLAGKVYYAYSDANLTEECPFMAGRQWSPYHSVILGPDFNVNPMRWNLGQFAYNKFWWFDEIHLNDSNTPEAAGLLRDKIMIMRDQGFRSMEAEVVICGDASGNARSTKGNDSDYDIIKQVLKASGIRYRDVTPEANPSIKDRVNAVNAKLKSASGEIGMFIHKTNCRYLIKDFERVVWKPGNDFILDPGKDRQLTHSSDGAGYPVHHFCPIKAVRSVGKMTVLTRTL